jgi:nucleolar pre-ribosomal-associated protein 1
LHLFPFPWLKKARLTKFILPSSVALDICAIVAPIILRLSLLPGIDNLELPSLLEGMLDWMGQLENTIEQGALTSIQQRRGGLMATEYNDCTDTFAPPHHAHRLWDVPSASTRVSVDPLRIWGAAIEGLWRVCMVDGPGGGQQEMTDSLHIHQRRTAIWQALTSRLLIWRALVGARASPLGEWARREVMENMQRATSSR